MGFAKVKENLERLGYLVQVFDTKEAAAAYLDSRIDSTTVGFGGSASLEEMSLYEKLAAHNTVYWHWRMRDGMTDKDMRMAERGAAIYVSSMNGLAETGEIINIDGNGNRVADIQYGHERVYLVAGINKLAPDFDAALWRARNIAAPRNAQRLGCRTPCAVRADRCYNCQSPARICRGLSVLWEKPSNSGGVYEVLLVNEELGY